LPLGTHEDILSCQAHLAGQDVHPTGSTSTVTTRTEATCATTLMPAATDPLAGCGSGRAGPHTHGTHLPHRGLASDHAATRTRSVRLCGGWAVTRSGSGRRQLGFRRRRSCTRVGARR